MHVNEKLFYAIVLCENFLPLIAYDDEGNEEE